MCCACLHPYTLPLPLPTAAASHCYACRERVAKFHSYASLKMLLKKKEKENVPLPAGSFAVQCEPRRNLCSLLVDHALTLPFHLSYPFPLGPRYSCSNSSSDGSGASVCNNLIKRSNSARVRCKCENFSNVCPASSQKKGVNKA